MNAITKGVEVTDLGISGLESLNEEEFLAVGKRLSSIEHGLQWAIGDWYNGIRWGDKAEACERVGLNFGSAIKYGEVAKAFKIGTRVPILSFFHHRMLTHGDLTLTDRKTLLEKAVDNKWSSSKLRQERDIIIGIAPPHPTKDYDNGVTELEKSVMKSLPKEVPKKVVEAVVKGLKEEARKLKHEFTGAVEKAAEAKAAVQRENAKKAQQRADEQFEKAVKMAAGVKAFMTKQEFMLIRACLHPDKNSHPQAAKAFDIFNRLADVKSWN